MTTTTRLGRHLVGPSLRLFIALFVATLALPLSALAQPRSPACQDGAGTISGKVSDADGRSAAGLDVLAVSENGMAQHQTTTDADGKYKLEKVCVGHYQVIALRRGPSNPAHGFYDKDNDHQPDLVEITDAAPTATDIDITLFTTAAPPGAPGAPGGPGAPVACSDGRGTFEGAVTDATGTPVKGADVVAVSTNRGSQFAAKSDADGHYKIEKVCAGDYYVVAFKSDSANPLSGLYDANKDDQPDVLTVADTGTSFDHIDIIMNPARVVEPAPPGGPGAPAPGACQDGKGSISGAVKDAKGQPVADVEVLAVSEGRYVQHRATTDADGKYTIEKVCNGEYMAFAISRDPNQPAQGFYDLDADGQPDQVDISDGHPAASAVDITLMAVSVAPRQPSPGPPGGGGGCSDGPGSISGKVTDGQGNAVEGADVLAVSSNGVARDHTVTDAAGEYEFEKVCLGSYQVVALVRDPAHPAQGFYDADGDGQPDSLEIKDGALDATDIDITLMATTAPGPQPRPGQPGQPAPPRIGPGCADAQGEVSGSTTNAQGDPVSGAKVILLDTQGRQIEAPSNAQGAYQFKGLCAGNYYAVAVKLSAAGELLMGIYDPDHDQKPDEIAIADGHWTEDDIDITLTPAGPKTSNPIISRLIRPGQRVERGTVPTEALLSTVLGAWNSAERELRDQRLSRGGSQPTLLVAFHD